MRLSVVIVNWNSRADLLVCLESLARQTHKDLEIVVVDNGSTDGSVEAVRERHPHCVVLAEGENLGFAEGCNRGIAESHGEWIALLNNDTVADRRWAERLVAAAESAPPTCGMLQSVLLFMDRPTEINSTGIVLTAWGSGNDRREGERVEDLCEEEIFCPTAGACAYRREMLEQIKLPVGYFDRDHFMYFEDLDLGWRARLAGWSAMLVPDSIVLHKYQASAVRHGHRWMIVLSHRNRLRTLIKNASPGFFARTMPRTLEEIFRLIRFEGVRGLVPLARAVVESGRQRPAVTALQRRSRHGVEASWVGRGGRPIVGLRERVTRASAEGTDTAREHAT
ncbi:MAG: glycosyltransferase family 2 protein [Deltaproteobacteria bacterium]|nr:glycosyltransferase family 2 protein [Deltaproteobacteria bacterium]